MKKHPWYKPRRYLHFDSPLSVKNAEVIATNPDNVKSHSFYPFIAFSNLTKKIFFDKNAVKIKSKEKIRPISYASHSDSAIYSYYSKMLSNNYEKLLSDHGLSKNVIAFRSLGKSNIDFAKQIFTEIEERKYCSAIGLDVTGFFDNLDHMHLKKMWAKVIGKSTLPNDHFAVFKSISSFSTVDKDKLYKEFDIAIHNPKNNRTRVCSPKDFRNRVRKNKLIKKNKAPFGIPQGSPISAILSNIYMFDFDKTIKEYVNNIGGSYYRYCDDMMIIVHPEERDKTISYVTSEILKLKLEINQKKTEISNFSLTGGKQKSDRPLQYLGFTFDGERILIRSAAFARFSGKMKGGVKLAQRTCEKRNIIRQEKGHAERGLYKRKIYERYSHLGKQNFLTYGYRAADKMGSKSIRKQLKPLWNRLQKEIENKKNLNRVSN